MPHVRRLAIALALAAAALSIADYISWRTEHRRLLALAARSGLTERYPEVEIELARETVAARARAKLAWLLLDLEIDRGWLAELPPDEREAESRRGLERLRLARELADDVLSRQPASWQAATVLGASRYLEASRRGRRDQPVAAWRQPLEAAMRLAPSYPEPPILLASAYLSRWSSLSGAEREELAPVLSRALEDARGLQLLIPSWVRRAPSLSQLLEPIPDRPAAWLELGREFLRLGDLERFGIVHRRRLESLPAYLAERVEEGRARLRAGQRKAGVALLLSAFSEPPDLAYVDSVSAALAALPENAATGRTKQHLERWLAWYLDLCAIGRCPLDEETVARLTRACGRSEASDRSTPAVDPPPRSSWSRDDWQTRGSTYRLQLRTAESVQRLRLEIERVPSTGAAIELRWDGRFLGVAAVAVGEPLLRRMTAAPGLHMLDVEHLSGRPLRPGSLSLEPAPPSRESPAQPTRQP
jgi:tetratricopeptide (TPR) repeat protein